MWIKKVTIKTDATKEQIWKLWTDVDNWNKWDKEVEFSELDGKFEVGIFGILKPTKGPKSKFELISVDKLCEFTSRSFLPLTKMDFIHEMEEKDGEIYITHGVKIRGLLTFLFSKVIGEKLVNELPKAMDNLSKLAKMI
ncbi:MAG: polyketide cyclase [Ignavibacteriae bacterium]|nr:polyketide cyclase [Ignavibacteriota bacterium]